MLRPGARTRPGRWHRGLVQRVSMLLCKEAVEMTPEIDFGTLRENGGGQRPAR
jgi:hypothetical protein